MSRSAIAAIVLAAGESGRMGTLKPLMPLGRNSVLERVVNLFFIAGISDIRVVTGHRGEEIRRYLPSIRVTWVHNENYHRGMLSSIKAGLRGLDPHQTGFFILPVDIPLVRYRTIAAMLAEWSVMGSKLSILYPTFMDKRGHPPLISAELIPEILRWNGQGGLNSFLETRESEARNLAVFDEYILKDMDTRPDYDEIVAANDRYDIPTVDECSAISKDPALFSDATASHCRRVARLAVFLGHQIASGNDTIHLPRISAAALLHDVAKGRPNHAHEGAALLSELGFSGIADIVACHMDIDYKEDTPLSDREVLYLADKLFRGDNLVSIEERFDDKLARYGGTRDAETAILKRKEDTMRIVRRLEKETGKKLQHLLDEFSRNTI